MVKSFRKSSVSAYTLRLCSYSPDQEGPGQGKFQSASTLSSMYRNGAPELLISSLPGGVSLS